MRKGKATREFHYGSVRKSSYINVAFSYIIMDVCFG